MTIRQLTSGDAPRAARPAAPVDVPSVAPVDAPSVAPVDAPWGAAVGKRQCQGGRE